MQCRLDGWDAKNLYSDELKNDLLPCQIGDVIAIKCSWEEEASVGPTSDLRLVSSQLHEEAFPEYGEVHAPFWVCDKHPNVRSIAVQSKPGNE